MTIQNERGFTLLEVIMAVSILSVGILAVASMQASALRGDAFAQNRTEGATWGQEKMEELIAAPYDDMDASNGDSQKNGYTVTVAVVAGPVADTKRVTITVKNQQNVQVTQLSCVRSKLLE